MRSPILTAVAFALAAPWAGADTTDPGIALPLVPQRLIAATHRDAGGFLRVAADASQAPHPAAPPALELGPKLVEVSPGTTVVVEVAIDHLNRIVTPFAKPQVRTVSQATTQVDGNVVYVATGSEAPVSLYIADADSPEEALALTLAPRRIPPREVRLLLAGTTGKPRANPSAAARWEAAQPYVETLVLAFRDLARNRVPSGYGLRRPERGERVRCKTPGLDATTGQALDGNGLLLLIARVRNTSKTHREIDERTCTAGTTPVAAVAAWPRLWLGPGEATELYLALRPRDAERERRDRPSLLGGRP